MSRTTLFAATLQLTEPVVAAGTVHDQRTSLFLRIDDDVVGWAECPVAAGPGIDATQREVRAALRALSAGEVTPDGASGTFEARGLVATARLDARLRGERVALAQSLGVRDDTTPFAGVVGVGEAPAAVARAEALVALGATRLRVKVAPDRGGAAIRAVLEAVDVGVVADANGSFDPRVRRDLEQLHALADLPLAWLEQPFAPGERRALVELADRGVVIGADESVRSPEAVASLAVDGVVSVVCVKPARVGVPVALRMLELARREGLSSYVGGYFEAGLGRAALAALSAAAATLDGDVAAPATYLVHDPCHLVGPREGRQPLHDGPGIGPLPDLDDLVVLEELTVAD